MAPLAHDQRGEEDQTPPTDHGEEPPSLGTYIRQRRVALDLSKSEAARRAGVARRTWHEIEAGTRQASSDVTLSQFDQALQLPEGTLYRMTARSASQQVESLRRQAVSLVRRMTTEELLAFVESQGAESIRSMIDELRSDVRALREQRGRSESDDGRPGTGAGGSGAR